MAYKFQIVNLDIELKKASSKISILSDNSQRKNSSGKIIKIPSEEVSLRESTKKSEMDERDLQI